jgi:hypothetical protein
LKDNFSDTDFAFESISFVFEFLICILSTLLKDGMDKKCLLLVMLVAGLAFPFCNEGNGKMDEISDAPVPPVASQQTAAPIDSTKREVATRTETTSTPKEALNPAHGEPGHRCDIPVGAPLSSPPPVSTKNASTSANQSSATSTFNKPVYDVDSAKGPLNPAHGQPGHRCDLAVGAPLTLAADSTLTGKNQASTNAVVNNQSTNSKVASDTSRGAATKDSVRKE